MKKKYALQFFAAVGAIVVFVADWTIATWTMSVFWLFLGLINDVGRYDTSWYSNNGVTQQHDECR